MGENINDIVTTAKTISDYGALIIWGCVLKYREYENESDNI